MKRVWLAALLAVMASGSAQAQQTLRVIDTGPPAPRLRRAFLGDLRGLRLNLRGLRSNQAGKDPAGLGGWRPWFSRQRPGYGQARDRGRCGTVRDDSALVASAGFDLNGERPRRAVTHGD